jgi:hypothetical protein
MFDHDKAWIWLVLGGCLALNCSFVNFKNFKIVMLILKINFKKYKDIILIYF